MSEWLTKVINDNQAKGRAEGKMEGMISTLADLVKDKEITIKKAAEKAGMSEVEFCKKAGLTVVQ